MAASFVIFLSLGLSLSSHSSTALLVLLHNIYTRNVGEKNIRKKNSGSERTSWPMVVHRNTFYFIYAPMWCDFLYHPFVMIQPWWEQLKLNEPKKLSAVNDRWIYDETCADLCNFYFFFEFLTSVTSTCGDFAISFISFKNSITFHSVFLQLMLTFEFYLYESASLDQFPSNSTTRISFHTRDMIDFPKVFDLSWRWHTCARLTKSILNCLTCEILYDYYFFFRNFYNSISSFSVSALFSVFFDRKTLFRVENSN